VLKEGQIKFLIADKYIKQPEKIAKKTEFFSTKP